MTVATATFHHARVFTGTGERDVASAFRIRDGRFTWVGAAAGLPAAERAAAIDLGGRTVLPGFLDVHTHPAMMATLAGAIPCLPPGVTSIDDLVAALRSGPDGPGWLEGYGYDDAKFPGGIGPTAADLDRVSGTRPILVHRCDGHSAVANTAALAAAGVTANTPDPPGASFGRHADGRPNGVLTELAAVDRVAAARPVPDAQRLTGNLSGLGRHFLSHGIVGVGDLLATVIPEPLRTFRAAAAVGPFPRTALYLGWPGSRRSDLTDLTDDDRTGHIRIAGVKLFLDGAYSNRTAWTEDAYPSPDRRPPEHGVRIAADDDLRAAADWCRRNRVQLAVHAMGDRALHRVVDLFADQEPWLADRPSIRLEHATLVSGGLLRRLTSARMRFAVVTHSIFLFAEFDSYARNLSARQFEIAYPIRSVYESGLPAALASDRPATAWADADDVFTSVQAAVTRRAYDGTDMGQAERISVAQALLLYTGRAAAVAPLDGLGRIAPGYDGSFVVLDRDPFTVPVDELIRVRVAQTWVRGELVFER